MKKILICGSRSIIDKDEVFKVINKYFAEMGFMSHKDEVMIIHGGAYGVDKLAGKWAKANGIPCKIYYAQWEKYGKKAGVIRNSIMVKEADYILAIWDGESRGTVDTIRKGYEKGIPVEVVILSQKPNIWSELGKVDAICVTTNNFFTIKNGKPKAVMGRGTAFQVKVFIPDVEFILGSLLYQGKCSINVLGSVKGTLILSFPVKPRSNIYPCPVVSHARNKFKSGDKVPGFLCMADLGIIEKSLKDLLEFAKKKELKTIALPLPGTGAGELPKEKVWTLIKSFASEFKKKGINLQIFDGKQAVWIHKFS